MPNLFRTKAAGWMVCSAAWLHATSDQLLISLLLIICQTNLGLILFCRLTDLPEAAQTNEDLMGEWLMQQLERYCPGFPFRVACLTESEARQRIAQSFYKHEDLRKTLACIQAAVPLGSIAHSSHHAYIKTLAAIEKFTPT